LLGSPPEYYCENQIQEKQKSEKKREAEQNVKNQGGTMHSDWSTSQGIVFT
jgi:hypothetical protein